MNRKRKIEWNREWLNQRYIIESLSTRQIAIICKVTQRTIIKWLKKDKIPLRMDGKWKLGLRSNRKIEWNREWLFNLYINKRYSSIKISKICNVSYRTILRWLKDDFIPIRTISQSRYGFKHSKISKIKIGKASKGRRHTKESKLKISKHLKGKICLKARKWFSNPLNKERIEKRNKKISKNNKTHLLWQNEDYAIKQRGYILDGLKLKPTRPERIVKQITMLNNLPFNYVGDGRFKINGFNPDFLSFDKQYIIEVNGNYWHSFEYIKEKNERKMICYDKSGYKTLVIWENEIYENPQKVTEKIIRFSN